MRKQDSKPVRRVSGPVSAYKRKAVPRDSGLNFPAQNAVDKVHVEPGADGIGQKVILPLFIFAQIKRAECGRV